MTNTKDFNEESPPDYNGFSNTKHESELKKSADLNGTDVDGSVHEKPLDLDDVLTNELGEFGWFQFKNILLVAVPIILGTFVSEYIFSAAAIPHRCRIPECGENAKFSNFEPEWLLNAIPTTASSFSSCRRFVPRQGVPRGTQASCPVGLFNRSATMPCEQYVYARNNSVVYEFDLGCQEWWRALAGTLSSVGTLLALPLIGHVSDRCGRRLALVLSVLNLGLFGLLRAFSTSYTMYLVLQLVQTTLGAGAYSSAYIFAAELVGPKYRVFTSATSSSMYGVGHMTLGAVAWLVQPWRYMIMALSIPCFLIVSYYWILSESVRWLLSKRKYAEARAVLQTVARVNKTHISEKSLEALTTPCQSSTISKEAKPSLIRTIFRSKVLFRRVCTTPIWWVTTILVYYGLSINSTSLSDTMYLNFILTSAVEVPGYYTAVLILDRIGRKISLSVGYFFCAACNIAFVFIPSDLYVIRLIIYLLGKFSISTVMTSMYLFTMELYPTEFRHTLLGFSSMIGRFGSIIAPLTPVLMEYWHGIPSMMFGGMAVLSGVLVFTQPETLGTKMPDTLEEAEALGRPETKLQKPS